MHLLKNPARGRKSPPAHKAVLFVEALESRLTPYSVSGNSWLQPQLISLSFMPDGTNLGGATSNMFATFNAQWAMATWQKEILRAAQVFAQQTNVNFTVVADDGSDSGSGAYQQGAANFGDVRIGGYSSGGGQLATATFPQPACNYSAGGDYAFNSSQPWRINQTGGYDLFTVAAHEMGHSLGLGHSTVTSAVLYATYNGIKSSLRTDDISGIRAIYSASLARSQDAYDAIASNGSFATATDISGIISNLTGLLTDRDITTVTDLDYYRVTVPTDTTGTMVVQVQSSGLSLLSPLVKVYDANQVEIGSASGLNQYGATLTVTINGVSAGQQYYVMVDGADQTAFGTGKYGLTLNFGSGGSPTVPLPSTQALNGSPLQCNGGIASTKEHDDDHDHAADRATHSDAAAQVVQALVGPVTTTVAAARPEAAGAQRLPAAAVDAVFTPARREEVSSAAPTVETEAADELFVELFA